MDNADRRSSAILTIQSYLRSRDDLLAAIDVVPDFSWQKGEPRRGSTSRYNHSGAEFQSQVARCAAPDEHVGELLGRMAPARGALRRLAEESLRGDPEIVAVQMRVIVESSGREVGISLASMQLRAIAESGAEFLGLEISFVDGPVFE